ncbi:MAG: hypothetical protein R6V54_07085 [Desulfobacteraceae bacterium]
MTNTPISNGLIFKRTFIRHSRQIIIKLNMFNDSCTKNKAKLMPPLFFFFIFAAGMVLTPLISHGTGAQKTYYARLDVKYTDNSITSNNLLLFPAENDFRAEKFTLLEQSGIAHSSDKDNKFDLKTEAKQDAIKRVLEQRGLKSIKSKTSKINGLYKSEVVMSYEGAVKLPCQMIDISYDKSKNQCLVTLKIKFSAIAFPDRWQSLKIKQIIKQKFKQLILFFHSPQ